MTGLAAFDGTPRPPRGLEVVMAGALAQKPWVAGHTWVFLQYLLGFRRLGVDVLFLDRLDAGMSVEEIQSSYDRHARAAREIAEECFDSDKVLSRLLRLLDLR